MDNHSKTRPNTEAPPWTGSWQQACLVGGALRAGIFRLLSRGPVTVEQAGTELPGNPRAIRVVLEALADLGYAHKQPDESYAISPLGSAWVGDPQSPLYRGGSLLHSLGQMERWLHLPEVIRTGEPLAGPRSPDARAVFIEAMREMSRDRAVRLVDLCLELAPGVRSVLDLGGGPGVYAAEFRLRGLSVTMQDYPEGIELVREDERLEGIELAPGDFWESLPDGPFDLVFLSNITHIYSPEENIDLFRRLSRILSPHGYLAIGDFVRGMSARAALFAVNMLVSTARGGTYALEDYTAWLAEAKLSPPKSASLDEEGSQLLVSQKA